MVESENKIAVTFSSDLNAAKAKQLAHDLQLPLIDDNKNSYQFLLVVTPQHLELQETGITNNKPIFIDFMAPALNYRLSHGERNKQLIARAVGIKPGWRPTVLDVTAGLGVDAFILASLGCEVVMLERSKIIWALLNDGLLRLEQNLSQTSLKITLHFSQAIDYIKKIIYMKGVCPDVIYFDPMYPERKKSALGKKNLRILREIVGADEDAPELMTYALQCAQKRVVVKRPRLAETLGIEKPNLSFSSGKSSRYDVYFTHN